MIYEPKSMEGNPWNTEVCDKYSMPTREMAAQNRTMTLFYSFDRESGRM